MRMKLSRVHFVVLILQSCTIQFSWQLSPIPYIKPMLLGRTFDYSKSTVGEQDIFPSSVRTNPVTTQHPGYEIKYEVIKSASDILKVLDVSGQLALKVMAGMVDIKGRGGYLTQSFESGETVQVLARISYRTVTKSITSDMKPKPGWEKGHIDGQHYVRSITYGGMLFATLKYHAKKGSEKEKIEAEVDGKVNAAKLQVRIKGQFEQLASSVKDLSTLTIAVTATAPLTTVPTDITSLLKVINDFPKALKEVNGGIGAPIEVELGKLSKLKDAHNDKFKFIIDKVVETNLKDVEKKYYDLQVTKKAVEEFSDKNPLLDVDKELGPFYDKVFNVITAFNNMIGSIDLNQNSNHGKNIFKKALDAYRGDDTNIPGKYMRKFSELVKKLQQDNRDMTTKLKKCEELIKNPPTCPPNVNPSVDELRKSTILKIVPSTRAQLRKWLPPKSSWILCYRATRDGWRGGDFHSRCDWKGPTVTIIRVQGYVFGGYSDRSWGRSSQSTDLKESKKAFIFSLKNKDGIPPFKSPVYQNSKYAINTSSAFGPVFGGGWDIIIRDNAHSLSGNDRSCTNFGVTYKPPPGYKVYEDKTKALLAGSYYFTPSEIEVFYLH